MFGRSKPKKSIYKIKFMKDWFRDKTLQDAGYIEAIRSACASYAGELIKVRMNDFEECKFVVRCTESSWYCIVEELLDSVGVYMKSIKY